MEANKPKRYMSILAVMGLMIVIVLLGVMFEAKPMGDKTIVCNGVSYTSETVSTHNTSYDRYKGYRTNKKFIFNMIDGETVTVEASACTVIEAAR